MRKSTARNFAAAYADYNRVVVPAPAGAKYPAINKWHLITASHEVGDGDNACWILSATDLVVDVDIKNGALGEDSFTRLCADLRIKLTPNVRTASGGFHCYLALPSPMTLAVALDDYPGIDFLSKGRQVVIAGSTTELGGYSPYNPESVGWDFAAQCPPPLLAALSNSVKKNGDTADNGGDDLEGAIAADSLTEAQVRDWLKTQPAGCSYVEWFAVLCRIKSWRNDPTGYKIARQWSRLSADKYPGDDNFKRQWRDIKPAHLLDDKRGIGVGGIVKATRASDKFDTAVDNAKRLSRYTDELAACRDKAAVADFVNRAKRELKKIPNGYTHLRKIVKAHVNKTFGLALTIAEVCAMYDLPKSRQQVAVAQVSANADWLANYCFCPPQNIFINVNRRQKLIKDAFNFECGKYMPEVQDGSKMRASTFCGDYGLIKRVDAIGYFPEDDFADNHYVDDSNGKTYYNIFNPAEVCALADKITDKGQAAFDLIMAHFDYLVGTDNDKADIMRQWLAHQIQNRGKLLRWAPFIQSGQGAGKSFLSDLMSHLLGGGNVGKLENDNLLDRFNDWAAYKCVNFCEEVHNKGETRDRIPNILKPKITDSVISIRPIYGKKMDVPNRTNYICFTNDPQGLPLEQSDRRWFVVISPLENPKDDLPRLTGMPYADYFDKLWATLTPQLLPQINRLLHAYTISDDFIALTGAPMTDDKSSLLAAQFEDNDGWDAAEDTLATPTPFYNCEVICTADFFNAVELSPQCDIAFSKWARAKWLRHNGFKAYPKRVTIDGKPRRVSVKDLSMTADDIRASLAGKPPTPNGKPGKDVPF